jgi:hypothetical protein
MNLIIFRKLIMVCGNAATDEILGQKIVSELQEAAKRTQILYFRNF